MAQRLILTFIICSISLRGLAGPNIVDSLKAAVENARQDTDKIILLISLSQRAPATDTSGKLHYALQALDIAKRINSAPHIMASYKNLGVIYSFSINNYVQAANYYNEYDSVAKQENDTLQQIDALDKLVIVYNYMDEYAMALECGAKALLLHPDRTTEASVLGNIGVIYNKVGDYPKAMDYFTRSLKATEQLILSKKAPNHMDTLQIAGLVYSIGEIDTKMAEYDKALENFDKAIYLSNNYYDITIVAVIGKATIFDKRGNPAASIDAYKKALELSRESQRSDYAATIFSGIAGQYLKTGNVQAAQNYVDSALAIAQQHTGELILPNIYIILAQINTLSKKYGVSVAYLNDAISIAHKAGALEEEGEAWEMLSNTYESMKSPGDAFAAYKHYIAIRDSMYSIEKGMAISRMDMESVYYTRRIADSVKEERQAAFYDARMHEQQVLTGSACGGVALMLLLLFFIYRNYSQQKKANILVSKANETIREEKQVSEALLRNILPEEVAKELKAHGDVQPKMFDNVTVLFTDFVDFTIAGDHLTPQELILELHTCFKAFDGIIKKYSIEKIKTVGDAYIAVSGLPHPNANHATDIINAALEIRDYMLQRKKEHPGNTFEIRIGVNSGSVVAGIVGVTKFAYDIWGDTVNVAARMEQHGEKGKVNISEKTYALVKDTFSCSYRGIVNVKNKGEMNMYFADRITDLG